MCDKLSQAKLPGRRAESRIIAAMTRSPFSTSASLIEHTEAFNHLANLNRLIKARWAVLLAMALLTLIAPVSLEIPLVQAPLLAVLTISALFNGVIHVHYRSATHATAQDFFRQLLIDMTSLSALLFLSGGATNPLVSLLLPPVAIAAITLPGRYVGLLVGAAVAAYSALLLFYLPLPLTDPVRATRLHLTGMWLIFVISAVMIAWFILRMTQRIRQGDAELAAIREQGLRDERILAIGTLAAGAAHELGTPLGTMSLITGEMANDPALSASIKEDIALLRQQISSCKEIITGLSQRAGAERLENSPIQAVDRWIEPLLQRWQAIRPQAKISLIIARQDAPPDLIADPRLEQALLNLLNNAANASPTEDCRITLKVSWNTTQINFELSDNGPGFPDGVLELAGKTGFPVHDKGQGIGLLLSDAAITQLGGKLTLFNAPDGGATALITLPRRH
mgnify:CR=1 FL=1